MNYILTLRRDNMKSADGMTYSKIDIPFSYITIGGKSALGQYEIECYKVIYTDVSHSNNLSRPLIYSTVPDIICNMYGNPNFWNEGDSIISISSKDIEGNYTLNYLFQIVYISNCRELYASNRVIIEAILRPHINMEPRKLTLTKELI